MACERHSYFLGRGEHPHMGTQVRCRPGWDPSSPLFAEFADFQAGIPPEAWEEKGRFWRGCLGPRRWERCRGNSRGVCGVSPQPLVHLFPLGTSESRTPVFLRTRRQSGPGCTFVSPNVTARAGAWTAAASAPSGRFAHGKAGETCPSFPGAALAPFCRSGRGPAGVAGAAASQASDGSHGGVLEP